MMKKNYMRPSLRVVNLNVQDQLLDYTPLGNHSLDAVGVNFESDEQAAKRFTLTDDEEGTDNSPVSPWDE